MAPEAFWARNSQRGASSEARVRIKTYFGNLFCFIGVCCVRAHGTVRRWNEQVERRRKAAGPRTNRVALRYKVVPATNRSESCPQNGRACPATTSNSNERSHKRCVRISLTLRYIGYIENHFGPT